MTTVNVSVRRELQTFVAFIIKIKGQTLKLNVSFYFKNYHLQYLHANIINYILYSIIYISLYRK